MGKYVFLTGYYMPKPGATGSCIHQIAKEAVKRGHDVTTVCFSAGETTDFLEGEKIVRVKEPKYFGEGKLNHLFSVGAKLIHIQNYPLRSNTLIKNFCDTVEEIIKYEKSAIIIASINPLEAVVAAAKIKSKKPDMVKVIYYCADTLSNEMGNSAMMSAEYRSKHGLCWENYLFSIYNKILIMECHNDHYLNCFPTDITNKMVFVNFPMLSKIDVDPIKYQDDVIHIVYAGTLYRKLRNPQYICKLLVDLLKRIKLQADFMGGGDCDDILDIAAKRSNGAVRRWGMQTKDVILKHICGADILLSIGNALSPMAPSKIYEYMSTGKPIIHVYTYDRDPCLEPLIKYGNSLLLREGEKDASEKVYNFIVNRNTLQFDDVRKKFYLATPEYTMDVIESV